MRLDIQKWNTQSLTVKWFIKNKEWERYKYTQGINRKLVSNAFKKTPFIYMTDESIDSFSRYPETTICTE